MTGKGKVILLHPGRHSRRNLFCYCTDAGVVALTFYFLKNRIPRMPNYLAALAASEHKEDLK